jgi:peptide/nickel transport system permease protein
MRCCRSSPCRAYFRLRPRRVDTVERAFGTPGLGYAMFTAVSERDIFVMQNLVFLYAVVFVMLNILVDLTIAWLDPRIRYQ